MTVVIVGPMIARKPTLQLRVTVLQPHRVDLLDGPVLPRAHADRIGLRVSGMLVVRLRRDQPRDRRELLVVDVLDEALRRERH